MLGRSTGRRSVGALSVIGADVTVTGDVTTDGDLHIDGTVNGDVTCGGVTQGASGRIVGTLRAKSARLSGAIEGAVEAEALTIDRSARIAGDVAYATLSIENGARVDGRMTPRGAAEAPLRLVDASKP